MQMKIYTNRLHKQSYIPPFCSEKLFFHHKKSLTTNCLDYPNKGPIADDASLVTTSTHHFFFPANNEG